MKITVIIDKALCIGSQTCVVEDPEHFVMDKDDRAKVRKDINSPAQRQVELEVTKKQKEQFVTIAKLCPTRAIRVVDEKGVQIFPQV